MTDRGGAGRQTEKIFGRVTDSVRCFKGWGFVEMEEKDEVLERK